MSLTGKSPSETYKDIIYVDNNNNGVGSIQKVVKSGDGSSSALNVSDRSLRIIPSTDNQATVDVRSSGGTTRFQVDTSNDYVKALGVHVNTQYKEFGLYDFSPTQGYHNPMICNNMMFSDSGDDIVADDSMFGNGADPATSLDLSSDGTAKIAGACYWYVQDDIYIDAIRVMATCDSSNDLNFHVYQYTMDVSSQHGDLASGTLVAHIGSSMSATSTSLKTDTLTIDSASVSAGRILVAFVENEGGTGDITAQLNIKYHITG
tara:strand:+ start:1567 stop:2352 length:786 start_codon:yes stop_codon:yes gene_type:complete